MEAKLESQGFIVDLSNELVQAKLKRCKPRIYPGLSWIYRRFILELVQAKDLTWTFRDLSVQA